MEDLDDEEDSPRLDADHSAHPVAEHSAPRVAEHSAPSVAEHSAPHVAEPSNLHVADEVWVHHISHLEGGAGKTAHALVPTTTIVPQRGTSSDPMDTGRTTTTDPIKEMVRRSPWLAQLALLAELRWDTWSPAAGTADGIQ